MNKGNDRLLAVITALRKMPRWVLVLTTVGIIVVLGVAMFMLIPSHPSAENDSSYLNSTGLAFSVFLKLGIIVVIIIGLAIVIKQMQSKMRVEKTEQISILETIHLSPHRSIYLLRVENEKILIGATDQNISTLLNLKAGVSIQNNNLDEQKDSFSDLLSKAQGK